MADSLDTNVLSATIVDLATFVAEPTERTEQ